MEENFAKDFFVVQFFKNYINTQMSYTLKVLTKGWTYENLKVHSQVKSIRIRSYSGPYFPAC